MNKDHPWSWTAPRDCHELALLSVRARRVTVLHEMVYPQSESFWFYRLAEYRSIRHRDGVLCAATNRKFDSRWRACSQGNEARSTDKFCLSRRTSEFIKFILGVRLYPRWKLQLGLGEFSISTPIRFVIYFDSKINRISQLVKIDTVQSVNL